MEKGILKEEIDYPLDHWKGGDGVSISKIREDLNTIEKLGATHVLLDYGIEWDCAYVSINGFKNRLETDEEFRARFQIDLQRDQEIRNRKLLLLEKLKEKYENK